ncbi:MAG TPA: rhodanese-like domain-containing protein [Ferruginibacter sp.]|nr:rhodanese-like domain-containing protein [Ferruginibacter sp.]HRO05162.1 rhodanese-like domain-containing protein [Ferruginibacter sp.]HRO95533.1 rhodanese-like domain-containing protein [Ferruginibacter sp.]HRP50254.1 rhodanese-like domain-containing protein [Ferruginibacter sp.]
MFIQQLYTKCLSEAAYYIESDGVAAIIDPMRDIDDYLQLAKERNVTIRYIFETHFHADFVSGHLDLARATGAPIVFGPGATTGYAVHHAKDGEVFPLGSCSIEVLHTPGHTMESVCYLLKDEKGKAHAVFTGDTLFVGDVGRPDLSSGGMSSEELAGILYQSLQDKILPLPDDVLVYPAHGPGSSCGKSLGPETWSTLGDQKKMNYALQAPTKESFIEQVTTGLQDAPGYFAINAQINQKGYTPLEELKQQGLTPLSIEAFKQAAQDGAIILDTRPASTFTSGFIPGSIFIGLEGRFAEWAGALLPFNQSIILVTDPGAEEASLIRLTRVGFEKISGYLEGGFQTWSNAGEPVDMVIDVEADELVMDIPHDPRLTIVDVRKEGEFVEGHLKNAINLPLSEMTDVAEIAQFNETQNLYIHCAGGYRSVIAASIFKKHGFHNLRNVLGGWGSISKIKNVQVVRETAALN